MRILRRWLRTAGPTATLLDHASPVTTHLDVEADLAIEERAVAKLHEPDTAFHRYWIPDNLIDFLSTL